MYTSSKYIYFYALEDWKSGLNKGMFLQVAQFLLHGYASLKQLFLQDGWCDTMGTVEEIQAREQQRQEAAIKRERAMAYAFSNQVNYPLTS